MGQAGLTTSWGRPAGLESRVKHKLKIGSMKEGTGMKPTQVTNLKLSKLAAK